MDRIIVKGLPQVGILPILNDAVKVAAWRRGEGLLKVAGPNSDIGLKGINAWAQLGHTGHNTN
jgi:hypothetical protein